MNYGTTDAVLKPLNEVLLPDPRFKFLCIGNEKEMRPFELGDMHQRLCLSKLNPEVPKDVQTQFQTTLNLMLYTWFVFEFHTAAEQHAYGALELALRLRFPKEVKRTTRRGKVVLLTIGPLLRHAVAEGLINPETLPAWKQAKENRRFYEERSIVPLPPMLTASEWLEHVIRSIPDFRNQLAHGNPKLYFEASFWALELCADLINAVFSPLPPSPA